MSPAWSVQHALCVAGGAHALDDRYGVAGRFAWVIDGATDLFTPLLFEGAEGNASWLAEQLGAAMSALAAEAPDGRELLRQAVREVDAIATGLGVQEVLDYPVAVAVVAEAVGPGEVEITVIGDSFAVVEGAGGPAAEPVTDPAWPALPAPVLEVDLPTIDREAPGRRERMVEGRRRFNGGGGRWVLRREAEALDHAHVQRVVTTGRVLLVSDGAERLLHAPGWDVSRLFGGCFGDPGTVLTQIRAFEDTHPDAWYVPHDDVTLLALDIVGA